MLSDLNKGMTTRMYALSLRGRELQMYVELLKAKAS